jgi:hypothetical protein
MKTTSSLTSRLLLAVMVLSATLIVPFTTSKIALAECTVSLAVEYYKPGALKATKSYPESGDIKINSTDTDSSYRLRYKISQCFYSDDSTTDYKVSVKVDSGDAEIIGVGSYTTNISSTFNLKKPTAGKTYTYLIQVQRSTGSRNWDIGSDTLAIRFTDSNTPPTNQNTNSLPPVNTTVTANLNGSLDADLGTFFNPLKSETLPQLLATILRILFALIGITAVIVIILAGFRMVVSSGNESEIKKAKEAITWAIVGLVVSLMAFSIVAIVQKIIQG